MSIFTEEDRQSRWMVTGGAGFIGSHVVDLLVSEGCDVIVYDDLSLSSDRYIRDYANAGRIDFRQQSLLDLDALTEATESRNIIWHLAANTDIPSGFTKTEIDINNSVIGTRNMLEAMRRTGVEKMLFASTGAVYGDSIEGTFREDSGPLQPLSLYGAGKIASEAFISAYSSLFGVKAWVFRFGNVIGARTTHGVIFDFIKKLKANPKKLEILGTGRGEKNYFLVEECIHGMLFAYHSPTAGPSPVVLNLGTDSTSKVMGIAEMVIEEMGLQDVEYEFTGTKTGWPGDQPVVLLDTSKVHGIGWHAKRTSDQAVRIAIRRLLGTEDFDLTAETLR